MDWRLIAAVAAAAGSFGLVAVGARAVLTAPTEPAQKMAAVPALTFAERFAAGTPSLTPAPSASPEASPSPAFTTGAAEGQAAPGPFAPPEESVFSSGRTETSPPVTPPLAADQPSRARPEPRAGGNRTAALHPRDDAPEPQPRPLAETKKPAAAPEIHAAPPPTHYRGVLTSTEIARIKHNLRLTPDQEPAWPRVEAALAEMGRQQVALIREGQEPRIPQNDWPPGRLYSIAGPLLQTLRPDQKETVRRLCRSLGFESVASML